MRRILLNLTPTRLVSRLAGRLARCPIPRVLRPLLLGLFARSYQVDMAEVEEPLRNFTSLSHFFIRTLKKGARPLPEEPGVLVSPVDARVVGCGPVEELKEHPIKGARFTVETLLGDPERATRFQGGTQLTLYLCPADYHRIHAPLSGAVGAWRHLPGALLPVNPPTLAACPGVFTGNERVTSYWEGARGSLAMVLVGALNVGSIHLNWDPALVTNGIRGGGPERSSSTPRHFARGEEAARFHLGSTVILLLPPGAVTLRPLAPGEKVRMGQALGEWIG